MGLAQSLLTESFPPKSHFSPEDIPDLAGRIVIVTGATSGIGKATAKELLRHNAKVYIAARDLEKATKVIHELKVETGHEGISLHMDLSDLKSIKSGVEDFLRKENELHVLFNNAAVMVPSIDQLTAQGYDLTFGTNVLGHFYLTKLLLPSLLAGIATSPDKKVRVVTTSSCLSMFSYAIDFNTLHDTAARRKKGRYALYAQSKLANVSFSTALARKYGEQGIISTSLNPGNIRSELTRHFNIIERAYMTLLWPILYEPLDGALTQLWAGTSPECVDLNGKYLVPWARVGKANTVGLDPALSEELWRWMDEQVERI